MGDIGADVREFDVIIIGAGPAGCTAALSLYDAGLKVAIIERSTFPRDKVCGESLHLKGMKALYSISPEMEKAFKEYNGKLKINRTTIHYHRKTINFDWVYDSFTVRRLDFDEFMIGLVKKHTSTTVFTGITPDVIRVGADGVDISIKNESFSFKSKIIIGADGGNSQTAKQLTNKVLDREHYFGAVRAYFKNVEGADSDRTQVFFNTKYGFNYLWIFPLKQGYANVGFGMLSSEITAKKINLKNIFFEFIKDSPVLSEKFKNAEQVNPLEGFGVPLGSKIATMSGDRFILTGDAASLSNPVSGTGMGNAMVSGKLAGDQVKACFKANDFSDAFMKQYDQLIHKAIIDDLTFTYKMQKFVSKLPFILDIVFLLGRNKRIRKFIQSLV
jgi:geranylgeranyl reductase family protein